MKKMIPLEKMSKKAKKQLAAGKRGSWGEISPVTKKVESRKAYDRKRAERAMRKETRFSVDMSGKPCSFFMLFSIFG